MIVILKKDYDQRQVDQLTEWLNSNNVETHLSVGKQKTIMGLIGDTSKLDMELIKSLEVVEDVKRIQEPYKEANRKYHEDDSVIDVNGVKIGGGHFQIIAGPCSVESREQIISSPSQ
jgi:3-deoxy-7-phosphoheptulonate synthase